MTTTAKRRIIWGAKAIADEIGRTERQTFHLLETGRLPATKIGGRWAADVVRLRALFHRDGEEAA